MQGSVRKRGSSWSYRFDMGIADGKRQQKEKGGFATRKEAEAALASAIASYNQAGHIFEPSEVTVADYLDQWFNTYCVNELKYNTQRGYRDIIDLHLKPAFGSYRLRALSTAAVQEYAYALKNKGLARHTIDGILDVLSGALKYAVEPLHYIPSNPAIGVRHPKVDKPPRERIILDPEEWERIIKRFKGTRYELPLHLGYHTGMRISEAFALTWDDIDLEKRRISVTKQVIKRNAGLTSGQRQRLKEPEKKGRKEMRGAWYFETPKTKESIRDIVFGDTLCQILKAAHQKQLEDEMRQGDAYTIHVLHREKDEKGRDIDRIVPVLKCIQSQFPRVRLVCIAENGQYTSTDTFKYASRVIHHEMQLAFDYHSLRHTHGTMLIEAGADAKDVQRRLGHTDISTTMNTYVHDTEQMQARTVELFEQIITQRTS